MTTSGNDRQLLSLPKDLFARILDRKSEVSIPDSDRQLLDEIKQCAINMACEDDFVKMSEDFIALKTTLLEHGYVQPKLPQTFLEREHTVISTALAGRMEFFHRLAALKITKRSGWIIDGVDVHKAESISDHMYRMSLLLFAIPAKHLAGIDVDKCIKLCLVHDISESIVGDITPSANICKRDKHQLELEAVMHLDSLLQGQAVDQRLALADLWNDYEAQASPEAVLVKDLDRFEMILQAYQYELDDSKNVNLQNYFDSTRTFFKTDIVKQWAADLVSLRHKVLNRTFSQ